ncbi:transcription termination factor MTERF8, chloroplastic-like isoform X2 [Iris pallida]|uniref:Transcription termination factor MTERF8, chloroplastic-like isoform X2 n=1 Tax=Iris pallida TaxID=29817 RepID=A0AAX6ECQ6_IRIPA|nr:transcription termination factor MTERF8, chloroplastic-like isoform X2 [Iris pallida]
MMLSLRKNLHFPPYSHFCLSSAAAEPNFITKYLVESCRFSPQRAAAVSTRISHLASPDRPDSVRHFLKHHVGFDDAEVRTLVSRYPPILCVDVDATVRPNFAAVTKALGETSSPHVRKMVLSNPGLLLLRSAVPRLEFWKSLLGGDADRLRTAFAKNMGLINYDVDAGIASKIAVLKRHGLSDADVATLVVRGQSFFRRSAASMGSLLTMAQELGFPRGSPMLVLSLSCFSGISTETLKARMEIYRSFGWSQELIDSALLKFPFFIRLKEENVRRKMKFLVGRAGCTSEYVARRPVLLGYSLEKRLIPRHLVLEILKSEELIERDRDLYGVMVRSTHNFVRNFITPHEDRVPTLLGAYTAACAGKTQDSASVDI